MIVTQPLPNPPEFSRGLTEQPRTDRILALAAAGLKPRDISSLLHIHPLIVLRVLANDPGVSAGVVERRERE